MFLVLQKHFLLRNTPRCECCFGKICSNFSGFFVTMVLKAYLSSFADKCLLGRDRPPLITPIRFLLLAAKFLQFFFEKRLIRQF